MHGDKWLAVFIAGNSMVAFAKLYYHFYYCLFLNNHLSNFVSLLSGEWDKISATLSATMCSPLNLWRIFYTFTQWLQSLLRPWQRLEAGTSCFQDNDNDSEDSVVPHWWKRKSRSGRSHTKHTAWLLRKRRVASGEQKYGRMEGDFHAQWRPDTSGPC